MACLLSLCRASIWLPKQLERCPLWSSALLTLEEALPARVGFVAVGLPAAAVGVVVVVAETESQIQDQVEVGAQLGPSQLAGCEGL